MQGDIDGALRAVATSLHAHPSNNSARARMAQILLSLSRIVEARGVLSSLDAVTSQSPRESATIWRTKALSVVGDGEKAAGIAQRAVMVQPWELHNWRTLLVARMEGN